MFEQELYKNEVTQVESQKGDLFYNYEIRNWDFSSTVYMILAISAVLNLSVLAFIGQTNLLTRRGCDSPFVGRVCQVLDMAYVGTVLFGTEREYVDMAYEKTDLGDAEITYVDVTNETPPLSYPAGYFQIANPVQFAMLHQQAANPTTPGAMNIPGFPMSSPSGSDSDLLKLRPKPPAPNPNAFQDDGTSSLFKVDDKGLNAVNRKRRGGGRPVPNDTTDDVATTNTKDGNSNTAGPVPTPKADPTPGESDEAKADQFGIFINKRPLKDKAKDTIEQVDAKTVKLDDSFKVVIAGTLGLGKDSKTVILKDPKPVPVDKNIPNDPAMVKLVQDWILAVGDAGWLGYLERLDDKKKLKSKKVIISVEQNDTDFIASIRSEQPSENEARSVASGLGLILSAAVPLTKGDEQTFLKSAAPPTSEGSTLVLNFKIPKPLVQEMIQRKLAESKEKENKPNSTALVAPNNKNAAEK